MRIAVMSDIHGNYHALSACVKHAKASGVEGFWFLGDYVGEFPNPQRTLELLYQLREEYDCVFIRGNKEDYLLDGKYNSECEWKRGNKTVGAIKYSYENVTDEDLEFFESMPISKRIEIEGMEPVLICHGAAESNKQKLLPGVFETEVTIACYSEKYVFCGHTHVQQVIKDDTKLVVNPGAVGVPLNIRGSAQYMLIESEGKDWKTTFITIPIDVAAIEDEIRASKLMDYAPYWCRSVIHLLKTGEVSQGTVLNEAMRINDYQEPWYIVPDECWEKALARFNIG